MTIKYANLAETTLNGAINDTVTSVVVTDASVFPSVDFLIRVESEIMLVTNVTSNTLTVTRGYEGTTAASHSSTLAVEHVFTAGTPLGLHQANYPTGSLPSVERAGQLYFPEANILRASDASNWNNIYPGKKLITPPSTGWSWLDQDTATISSENTGELLTYNGNNTGDYRCRARTVASPTAYTVVLGVEFLALPILTTSVGCFVRDTTTGKLEILYFNTWHKTAFLLNYTWNGSAWSSVTVHVSKTWQSRSQSEILFFKFVWNTADVLKAYIGPDPQNMMDFNGVGQAGVSNPFSGNDPDQAGFLVRNTSNISTNTVKARLVHYEES